MSLAQVAEETLLIIERGWFETCAGKRVELQVAIEKAAPGLSFTDRPICIVC